MRLHINLLFAYSLDVHSTVECIRYLFIFFPIFCMPFWPYDRSEDTQ